MIGFLFFQAVAADWPSMGIGGAVAVIALMWGRQDRQNSEKLHEERNKAMLVSLDRNSAALEANAKALATVEALVEGWDRRQVAAKS